jgi:Rrf2 family iron-sulfur cluster assembly transcriptional regulator
MDKTREITSTVRLSVRGMTAVGLMAYFAGQEGQGPTTLVSATWRLGVSLSYLESLCKDLRAKGFLTATRGPGGGYGLARPAQSISILEILQATESPPESAIRLARPGAGQEEAQTLLLYEEVAQEMARFLSARSLDSLLPEITALDRKGARQPTAQTARLTDPCEAEPLLTH